MRKARTMMGGRHFKVIREGGFEVDADHVMVAQHGDDLVVDAKAYDAFEDMLARGRREGEKATCECSGCRSKNFAQLIKAFREDRFHDCTGSKLFPDGSLEIHCKLGLWSASGQDREFVEKEARRYWAQYYADGEYDDMLAARKRKAGGEA